MVADHAAEPAALVAAVSETGLGTVGDVGRRGHTDGDGFGIAPRGSGRLSYGRDGPFGDRQVGELQDEPVADLAGERQGLGAVSGHPYL